MKNTFIKNLDLIEESYQVDDLLDFKSIIDDFKERINKIDKNSVVGLIGPYGSGKSTMLYQIYKDQIYTDKKSGNSSNQQTEKWFIFDAWQYPERKDLWEGFVLDIARQYNAKLFKKIRKRIDGTNMREIKALGNTVTDILSLKYPPVRFFKNFIHLFQTSPIKRVYDFQDLLSGILNKIDAINKKSFIVIEDIDRSGDMGVFFLETLKHFIKTQEKNMNHKVIVIVPIGNDTFYKSRPTRESYLKILDYHFPFNTSLINFTNFIEHTIDIDMAVKNLRNNNEKLQKEIEKQEIEYKQISEYEINKRSQEMIQLVPRMSNIKKKAYTDQSLQEIFMAHIRYLFETMILNERQGTIRDIKSILRKVNSNFNELDEFQQKLIDIRILILFTTIAHFYRGEKNKTFSFKNETFSFNAFKYYCPYFQQTVLKVNDQFWGKDFFLMINQLVKTFDEIIRDEFIIDTGYENHIKPPPPIHRYHIMDVYFKITKVNINYQSEDFSIRESYTYTSS